MKTIYSSENKLQYVLEYLQEQVDKDLKLYQPSKERYNRMMLQCKEIMKLLCKLLQQDELEYEDIDEFSNFTLGTDARVISDVINDMEDMVSKLKTFGSNSENYDDEDEDEDTTSVSQLSSSDRHDILITYSKAIDLASKSSSISVEKHCAKILKDWMSVRLDRENCKTFHYSVNNLATWISHIVYVYGYFVNTEDITDFDMQFYSWIDEVKAGTNTYALPYFINQIVHEQSNEYVSLTSVVLWDMLISDGLHFTENCMLPIKRDMVYELCSNILDEFGDNGQLDSYTNYKYDSSILKKSKLIQEGE